MEVATMGIVLESVCSCRHPVDCIHECHGRHCDPTEHTCSIEFLPDDGGLTPWGCPECTPGIGVSPHLVVCPIIATVEPVVEVPIGSPELH